MSTVETTSKLESLAMCCPFRACALFGMVSASVYSEEVSPESPEASAAAVVEAVAAAAGSVPSIVSEAVPADLPEKVWRPPFFSTVTTLGSPTRISSDFLGVYSCDQAP